MGACTNDQCPGTDPAHEVCFQIAALSATGRPTDSARIAALHASGPLPRPSTACCANDDRCDECGTAGKVLVLTSTCPNIFMGLNTPYGGLPCLWICLDCAPSTYGAPPW